MRGSDTHGQQEFVRSIDDRLGEQQDSAGEQQRWKFG